MVQVLEDSAQEPMVRHEAGNAINGTIQLLKLFYIDNYLKIGCNSVQPYFDNLNYSDYMLPAGEALGAIGTKETVPILEKYRFVIY